MDEGDEEIDIDAEDEMDMVDVDRGDEEYESMRDDDASSFFEGVSTAVATSDSADAVVENVEHMVEIAVEKSMYYHANPERAWRDVQSFAEQEMLKPQSPDNRMNWLAAFERSRRSEDGKGDSVTDA